MATIPLPDDFALGNEGMFPRSIRLGMLLVSLVMSFGVWPAAAAPAPADRECRTRAPSYRSKPSQVDALDLADVRRRAIERSPTLASLCAEIDALAARVIQASLRPNPKLRGELEDFGGSGDVSSFNVSNETLILIQRLETAGKREKRRRVAEIDLELVRLQYQKLRSDLLARSEAAFVAVLAEQERVALLEDLVSVAESSFQSAEQSIAAGAASSVVATQASVDLAAAEIQLESERHALEAARAALAATWGALSPDFERVMGELVVESVPGADAARQLLEASPRAALLDRDVERQRAVIVLEDARGTPDVTFAFGVRRFEDLNDTGFVAALEFALPIFDRNQGERAAARAELRTVRNENAAARAELHSELSRLLEALAARANEVRQLRERILPRSTEVLEEVRQGHMQGRFRSSEVIDAQRRLLELRLREIDAIRAYSETRLQLRSLISLSDGASLR